MADQAAPSHLNPLALKWVEELESTKIPQARSYLDLGDDGGCCCLGIACRVLAREGLIPDDAITVGYTPGHDNAVDYYSCNARLPWQITDLLGLRTPEGDLFDDCDSFVTSLTDMNDTQHKSFVEIAAFIRETPALFKEADDV